MTAIVVLNGLGPLERVALLVMAGLVLVMASVHLWPVRMSGPLLADERSRIRGRAMAVLGLLAIIATVGSTIVLAVDLRPRGDFVLVSRARNLPPDCRVTTWPSAPAMPSACGLSGVDLGPVVDRVLDEVSPEAARSRPREEVLDALGRALQRELDALDVGTTVPVHGLRARPSRHPAWVIQTVELALVRALADDRRLESLIVAPPGYRGDSLWQTLAELLSGQDRDRPDAEVQEPTTDGRPSIRLIDESEIPSNVHVRALRHARYEEDGSARVWALVAGELPQRVEVELVVLSDGVLLETIQASVPPDDAPQRLVTLQLRCEACVDHPGRQFDLVARWELGVTTTLSPAAVDRTLRLELGPGLDADRRRALTWLLSAGFRRSHSGQVAARELLALGLPLPESAESSDGDTTLVDVDDGAWIVARDAETAEQARQWLQSHRQPIEGGTWHGRWEDNEIGPSTAWSYEHVGMSQPWPWGLPEVSASLVTASVEQPGDVERSTRVGASHLGRGWAVVRLEAPDPERAASSFETVGFVRTLAWLAGYVRDEGSVSDDGDRSTDDAVQPLIPGGLGRSMQRARLGARQLVVLMFSTIMFAFTLWRLARVRRQIDHTD